MFNLTQQEQQTILFLTIVALVGMGTNILIKKGLPIKTSFCLVQEIGKVNLNTADKDLLMSIPGIGEKIAKRIIDYRKQKGNFNNIEELRNIKGVNNYRYEKLKTSFVVR